MSAIFVALACWDYEGSSPICAFTDLAAADEFVRLCGEYHQTAPKFPEDYDKEPEFTEWGEADDRWRRAHPAGPEHASCNSFSVGEIELIAAPLSQPEVSK